MLLRMSNLNTVDILGKIKAFQPNARTILVISYRRAENYQYGLKMRYCKFILLFIKMYLYMVGNHFRYQKIDRRLFVLSG